MSTRAIIALPTEGGYNTAWCWNDGGPQNLGRELRTYFKEEWLVKLLIEEHSFSSIWGPKTIKEYMLKDDTAVVLPNVRFLLKHPHNGKVVAGSGEYGFFSDVKEMLEQDINYVYVFENGKWKTYK